MLSLNGFELAGIATNGAQVVEMFKDFTEKPDVILMDHRMPVKNGIDASKEILQINPDVKILFITADQTIKKEAFSIGIAGFIDKPFTIQQLISSIKQCLDRYNW